MNENKKNLMDMSRIKASLLRGKLSAQLTDEGEL